MFRARKEALRAVAGGLKSQKRTLFKMPNYNYRNFGIAPLYSRANLENHLAVFQGHIDWLNRFIEGTKYHNTKIGDLILLSKLDPSLYKVHEHALEYYNHFFFFSQFTFESLPPHEIVSDLFDIHFGGFSRFKKTFAQYACTHVTPGYTWLIERSAHLEVVNTRGANNLLFSGTRVTPLLCLDMWEHAYYDASGTNRSEYVEKFLDSIDWSRFFARYETRKRPVDTEPRSNDPLHGLPLEGEEVADKFIDFARIQAMLELSIERVEELRKQYHDILLGNKISRRVSLPDTTYDETDDRDLKTFPRNEQYQTLGQQTDMQEVRRQLAKVYQLPRRGNLLRDTYINNDETPNNSRNISDAQQQNQQTGTVDVETLLAQGNDKTRTKTEQLRNLIDMEYGAWQHKGAVLLRNWEHENEDEAAKLRSLRDFADEQISSGVDRERRSSGDQVWEYMGKQERIRTMQRDTRTVREERKRAREDMTRFLGDREAPPPLKEGRRSGEILDDLKEEGIRARMLREGKEYEGRMKRELRERVDRAEDLEQNIGALVGKLDRIRRTESRELDKAILPDEEERGDE
eukprot:TRINITY_DN14421_c0_g1_i1.p1 TRINITY_DN14421_c0_g1~~TRINITY_DN14421_c0_g1_i1.p1  ORF type:complete len:574 (-),score=129.86 TRINITY_DN14421_c0_g1_i1:100-1821(-)